MSRGNYYFSIALLFSFLFCGQAFPQGFVSADSIQNSLSPGKKISPQIHYSVGSSFIFIPRYGSIFGLNASAFYAYPVSSRLSVEGGLIAGRYYSALKNINPENKVYNSFNTLSVYGTAAYQLTQKLTIYGTGIKQLAGTLPLYNIPSGSFTIGSTLNFGNFSVGASIQMSEWNNYFSPARYGGIPDYLQPFPW